MSEIKVNKLTPRTNCGTVQLGDSGDTITIPSGATITNNGTAAGFGATGAASWNTTVKTGDFTATAGEGYFVNTTSGEIDVTLPAGSPGAVVAVKDYAGTWDTNNCIIISNGSEKIGGSTNNATLSTEGLSATFIYIDATQGWLVTDDGLQSVAVTNPYIVATGGTITCCGNCRIHTFTGPGTFSVTKTATAATDNIVSHLVIAGGAGGGGAANNDSGGGGGGAGGYREVVSPSSPYTGSPLDGYPSSPNRVTVTATDFPITVGSGGSGAPAGRNRGISGSNSSFSTITSAGGGAGGAKTNNEPDKDPLPGGSGGGGTANTGCALPMRLGNQPPTSPAQGNPGGSNNVSDSGGGGGGAAAAGFNANTPAPNQGGFGGTGTTSCITASPVTRAGGGGGGNYLPGNNGTGGPGGGGNGGRNTPGTNGSVNTGSGGGGAGSQGGGCISGGSGGSGIVVIRYRYQ